jgi:hypothetical protein
VPQGVTPMAQLAKVPNTWSPAGLAAVRINGVPAAGPAMRIGVLPWMRRAKGEGCTCCQPVGVRRTSITETPIAWSDLRTLSALHTLTPSVCSSCSSVYSWFITSRPRWPLASSAKKCMPSWCMPACTAWSAALLLASGAKAGICPAMPVGVPQG